MRQVSVTELKNKLSEYLRMVKQGETIEVLERSIPIARLQGLGDTTLENGLLERLVRDGIVTRAKRTPVKTWLKKTPVPCRVDVVEILVEERGRDRSTGTLQRWLRFMFSRSIRPPCVGSTPGTAKS